uniref:TetR/AcrR family transcriptional regulator n=2 Tax=Acidithiobacillus thiooxidans TaxID=930 RepID=UPI0035B5EA26
MISMNRRNIHNPGQTRSDLLDAAYHEILESGFQAASLERILAKTSVSKGALYHHFGTKHDLGLAVITEVIRPQLEERWITLLAQHDNPIKGLCNLIAEEISHADESVIRYGCPLNNLIQEMSPLDESFRQGLQKIFERWVEVVAKALKKGQSEGQVRSDMTPEDIALYLVASIEGCVGLGKNTQSVDAYQRCLRQLQVYIQSLAV